MTSTLPLSASVFVILSGLIEERLGLYFGPDDREMLAAKITPRAVEHGFDSLLDYYYFLRYDSASSGELAELGEVLVVNETYFFREADQLRTLVDVLVREVIEVQGSARIWCAACSTGEEPTTIAGLLYERGLLHKVQLVASDLSERALARARSGVHGKRSRRTLVELPGWLSVDGDTTRVHTHVLSAIDWRRINLLDGPAIAALGQFELIVCRNVLIYFREAMAMRVLRNIDVTLRPGGHLLVGASESLLRFGTSLECQERRGVFTYRKAV